jgi:two-component system, LuxR family, sensor kinase FixL
LSERPVPRGLGVHMKMGFLPALLPLVTITIIFCLYLEVAGPWFVYDPPLLVPALNIVFLSFVSFIISRISGKAYWYGLGLVLIPSGLLALYFVFVVGSPIAWAGRIGLYAGGIYLLIAVSKAVIAARGRKVPLERMVADLLQKPRALYESLVGATTDAIVSLDSQARILLWNPAAERLFGYAAEEVLGTGLVDLIIPKEQAGILEDALQGGVSADTRMEADARDRVGLIVPVEISISRTTVDEGRITTLIIRDIQDRKRTERALQESEKRHRNLIEEMLRSMEALALERSLLNAVLEQMPAGVIIAEAGTGKPILGNNKAEMLWMEGFREDKVEEWPLTRSIRSGEVLLEKEISFRRSDGTRAIMSANSAPVYDEQHRIIAGVITFHDITARKEMENELRKSRHELEVRVKERTAELERKNKELQDFAFIASHDLHEPLRKIQTFGDLLVRKFERFPDELARDYISRMQEASARMELLLDSLLSYSRLTSKVQTYSRVALTEAVQDALSNLEIRIKETGGSIDVAPLPTLEVDSSQISQVFQNLIGNALKFHRHAEQPRIRIYSRLLNSGSGTQEICVEDNGIGFDEKYLDRIFTPFQRLHGRNEYNGAGMGLAICKKIVERHGGTITAKSAEGKGSTFIFTLPEIRTVDDTWSCQ